MTYDTRTPDSVKADLESYTEADCLQLAKFLQTFMADAHNARDFLSIAEDKHRLPHERISSILGHAYDWFRFGT